MAVLKFLERRQREELFGMGSGYVLDFSNRTIQEFVSDTVQKDLFADDYLRASGSKANRMRAFWEREPDDVVGRLISAMIDYAVSLHPTELDARLVGSCRKVAERLVGASSRTTDDSRAEINPQALQSLRLEFHSLISKSDRQQAGLLLESLLNRLFKLSGLPARESFRVIGEQIDGAIELDHEIYLVEAKWEKEPLSGHR